jgi:acyl-CoA synthetase (AMP-forming)/AMP-acid ligase II
MMVAVLPFLDDQEDQGMDVADVTAEAAQVPAIDAGAPSTAEAGQGRGPVGSAPAAAAAATMAAAQLSPAAVRVIEGGVMKVSPLAVDAEGEVWVTGQGMAEGYVLNSSSRQPAAEPAPAGGATAAASPGAASPFQQLQLAGVMKRWQHRKTHVAAADVDDSTLYHPEPEELEEVMSDLSGLSVAAGPGMEVGSVTASPQRWFRTGDLGKLSPEGE